MLINICTSESETNEQAPREWIQLILGRCPVLINESATWRMENAFRRKEKFRGISVD